ncbi:MAG: T9SS type A sorting domain-containing protein [Caldithrix sp.]|nr:T9SS type A sorting domain-containing protein [Caldithrix sp.]
MKNLLLMVTVICIIPFMAFGQQIIDEFDQEPADTSYWYYEISENADTAKSYTDLTYVDDPVKSGEKALHIDYGAHDIETWGGYSKIEHWHPDSNSVYDFSAFDTLSLWYNNVSAQSLEGRVNFRLELFDVSDAENGNKTYSSSESEFYYSFHYILDDEPGWQQIKLVLKDGRFDPNLDEWGGEAFNRTGWAGITGNDQLDLDKIKGWGFEFSISGSGSDEVSEGSIVFDRMELIGPADVSVIFFNGNAIPSTVTLEAPWSGSAVVAEGEGYTEGTNAIKWEGGAQWAGPVFALDSPKNLQFSWMEDSVKFKIKAPAGIGQLRLHFSDTDEDGEGTEDWPYEAHYFLEEAAVGYDGTWKEVAIPLSDFNRNGGFWAGDHLEEGMLDSSKVKKFGILASGGDISGNTIYLDDVWTGNPIIDIEAPPPPTNISGIAQDYYNLVIWQDSENETDETYDVYASMEPITNLEDENVDLIASGVSEDVQSVPHYLRYPLQDKEVDVYYAVVCSDAAGNESDPGMAASATTNTAEGIATISPTPPANFAADGLFGEWDASGIQPFVLSPDNGYVPAGLSWEVTDGDDLTGTVWIAVDDDYLYVAGDVIDDVYNFGAGDWWNQDALEMFIGLYDYRGAKHQAYQRGAEPDYKVIFKEDELATEPTWETLAVPDDGNYYFEGFNPDYVFEAKISLDSILKETDERFYPVRGMRLPFELYFHDNDGSHEGNLAMSPYNTDHAWQSPTEWVYTWIGDTTHPVTALEDETPVVAQSYSLDQNYPNPFNPATTIEYSIANQGRVQIDIYNVVGQKVKSLLDEQKSRGTYQVQFDGSELSSGIYFYRIQAGDYTQTRKMILMK